jgi:Glyoxalase-like domain
MPTAASRDMRKRAGIPRASAATEVAGRPLGATEVHWDKRPPDADYLILADPEGNRFCVVDTTR